MCAHAILDETNMDILPAIILGFVQGITEFLPISSSGHLVLLYSVIGEGSNDALVFDAILYLATASAVVVYFFDEIWVLVQTALRKFGRLPVNEKDMTMLIAILVGILPAIILGLFLESFIEALFIHPLSIAAVLVIGSGFLIFAEYKYQNTYCEAEMSIMMGLKIGFFQTLALIPGFSRSGATIAGGMLMGLTRSESTQFGFLLAAPLLLGAGGKKIMEFMSSNDVVSWTSLGVGAIVAFIVGLLAIHFMISFIRKNTLWPFIWYRLVLALFVVFVFFFN